MTFSSRDPRALGAYIRHGMRPWWPLLYLELEGARFGPHDAGVVERPADAAETARLSLAWTGIDRSVDFAFYARLPDAAGFVVEIDGRDAAVGWARRELASPGRWLEHATIAPDADPIRAAFADPARRSGGRPARCGRARSAPGGAGTPRGGRADR